MEEGQVLYSGAYSQMRLSSVKVPDLTGDARKIGFVGSGSSGVVIKVQINKKLYIGKKVRADLINPSNVNVKREFLMTNISRSADLISCSKKYGLTVDKTDIEKWCGNFEKTQEVVGQFKDETGSYILMEYIQSAQPVVKDITTKILYYALLLNKAGIAHCDVASRNWIMTREGPILIDFGIATKFDEFNDLPMPYDVTPNSFNIGDRGLIQVNHDIKGFYRYLVQINNLPVDESIVERTEQQSLGVQDLVDLFKGITHDNDVTPVISEEKKNSEQFDGNFDLMDLLDLHNRLKSTPGLNWVREGNNMIKFKDQLGNMYYFSNLCKSLCGIFCCCICIGCPCLCSILNGTMSIQKIFEGKGDLSDVKLLIDSMGRHVKVITD